MKKQTMLVLIIMTAIIVISWALFSQMLKEEREIIPMDSEIENKGTNEIIYLEKINYEENKTIKGPEIFCQDKEEFLKLIEPKEKVYIGFKLKHKQLESRDDTLKKVYWSFKNSSEIIIYEDTYQYSEEGIFFHKIFEIEDYNNKEITFYYSNIGDIICLPILVTFISAMLLILISINPTKNSWSQQRIWTQWEATPLFFNLTRPG